MNEPYENENHPIPPNSDSTYCRSHPKSTKGGLSAGKAVAVALVCSLLGGLFGAGGLLLGQQFLMSDDSANISNIYEGNRQDTALNINQIDTGKLLTPAEVYAGNVNSTVGITTSVTTNYWGYPTTSAASGSGFIISDDGYLLTNFHVIDDSDSIIVTMFDGTTHEANLIGFDKSNDVAILKIDAQDLTPVVFGNSDHVNVGDSVVAIGNPLGELTFSLTSGAISAKDREITMSNGSTMRLMQTDCAINSGNSGGALFNLYGEVIGITNAKFSSNSSTGASIDNIGFAIPINQARNIAESIIEKGYVSKPYIGVSVVDVSAETQSYGLPQGAAVKSVTEGSPAAAAGLETNDIITHVNETELTGSSDLVSIILGSSVGETYTLTVYRRGETLKIPITIGEQIQSALEQPNSQLPQSYRGNK